MTGRDRRDWRWVKVANPRRRNFKPSARRGILVSMKPQSRLPHLLRGSSAAIIATFAALFSHIVGGGAMPESIGVAVPLLLSLMVCILLAGRKLSVIRLSVSVIASQVLFHALFVLGTPTSSSPHSQLPTGHHYHVQQILPVPVASDHTMTLVHGDALMWVSHLVGAIITIVFLFRGERAIHHLCQVAEQFVTWVGCRFTVPLRLPVVAVPVRLPVQDTAFWTVISQIYASTVSRRGPPMFVRVARQPLDRS